MKLTPCPKCQYMMDDLTVTCPRCRAQEPTAATPSTQQVVHITNTINVAAPTAAYACGKPSPRNKIIAIVLAMFFGLFTWCYTYRADSAKFWLHFLLSCFTAGIWFALSWPFVLILTCVRSNDWYESYYE